jgi:hypothetical protein
VQALRNLYLRKTTAAEVDEQVRKVLRGLGNPKPPLRLNDVRELLKLDRQYYSKDADGILRETISRLKVAGKQILRRPSLLLDAIRKAELKALYVPDRKIILIDQTEPEIKQRWSESHEVIHSLLEWHGPVMLGDDKLTLNLVCHDQIEAEANYGAGRLLFLQEEFERVARDSKCSLENIRAIGGSFGNSITSTLWRFVELMTEPALGLVSQHPRYTDDNFDANDPCRYFIRSSTFVEQFSNVNETAAFALLRSKSSWRKYGPIANDEVVLADDNGESHIFQLDAFYNHHETLAVFVYKRPISKRVVVIAPEEVRAK